MPNLVTTVDDPAPGAPVYRVFRVTQDGRVEGSEVVRAQTDDEAKAIAARIVNGHGIDLWERARFLASYPPSSASHAGPTSNSTDTAA